MSSPTEKNAPMSRCNICGNKGRFVLRDLEREGKICANCSASSRVRAVIYVLGACLRVGALPLIAWPKRKTVRILESSGRSSYPMMLREKFEYYNTEYSPESELTEKPFSRFADLQHLAYRDEQFDYIIATDVFEHVRDDEQAFSEVFRVLKADGIFIMTVPYDHDRAETVDRVKTQGDKDIVLLPPEYHGGGGQTLTYRNYGRDLLDRIRRHGFSVGYLELEVPGYEIDQQPVFVNVKGAYIDLSLFHPGAVAEEPGERLKASPLILFRLFVALKYNVFSIRHFLSEVRCKVADRFKKP